MVRPEGVVLDTEKLKKYRYAKRMTQGEVAEAVGITVGHYRNLETGRGKVSLQVVGRLEKLFHVRPGGLQ